MRLLRGYTLIEMLVALTIVLVLASMLGPVFIQAKEEAKKTACAMNYRQVYLGLSLYQVDYEDRFVVPKYTVGRAETAETDRTWVQLVQPYLRSFDSTRCPADYTKRPSQDLLFDQDLVFGDSSARYYTLSTRANTGFNFIYLSPLVRETNGQWTTRPRSESEIQDPSETLIFGDSVWEVSPKGVPSGGGSYLVIPPCRYVNADRSDSFGLAGYSDSRIFKAEKAWDIRRQDALHLGGLWPWHQGHMTTVMADGSVKMLTPLQVSAGCDVQPRWAGGITDLTRYIWDLH